MNKNELLNQLTLIFQDVFDNDDIALSTNTTADNIEEWDSLGHIRLIAAIEIEFNVSFDLSDIEETENVGDFLDILISKLK